MKQSRSRIAMIALTLTAGAIAHADSRAYSGGGLSFGWYASGPGLESDVYNSFYDDYTFDYGGVPSYGFYSNSVYNGFSNDIGADTVLSTADGTAFTSFLGEEQVEVAFFNPTDAALSVTFSADAYAEGAYGANGAYPDDWGTFLSTALMVEDFGNGSYAAAVSVDGNEGPYEYASDSGQVTFSIAPDQELVMVGYVVNETVVGSTNANAAPGPLAVLPFGVGFLGLMRRRRAR